MSTQVASTLGFDAIIAHAARIAAPANLERFLFVRHGETEGNRLGLYQTPETPLNQTGLDQARAASDKLRGHAIARVVASPMARAWRTAQIVCEPHALLAEPDGALQERLFLSLAGKPVGTLDWAVDPDGCERLGTFVDRSARSLARVIASAPAAGETAVVSHGGVLLVALAMFGLELAPEARRNALPILFERSGGRWRAAPV
jgi:broad specificity phosphatase PhoE